MSDEEVKNAAVEGGVTETAKDTNDAAKEEDERLAAAKKRFEELKKKNKKKNKKKSKTGDEKEEKSEVSKEGTAEPTEGIEESSKSEEVAEEETEEVSREKEENLKRADAEETSPIVHKNIEVSPHLDAIVKEEVQARTGIADATEVDLQNEKFDKEDFEETAATAALAVEAGKKFKQYEIEIRELQEELEALKLKHETEVKGLKEELATVNNEKETYKARLEESERQNQRNAFDHPGASSATAGAESDVSLSPPTMASSYRPRVGSLVAVDLMDVSNARHALEKWTGWQVDLRQWRSQGVGSIVTL